MEQKEKNNETLIEEISKREMDVKNKINELSSILNMKDRSFLYECLSVIEVDEYDNANERLIEFEKDIDSILLIHTILESLETLEEALSGDMNIKDNISKYVDVVLKCLEKIKVVDLNKEYLEPLQSLKKYYDKIFAIVYKIMKYEMVYSNNYNLIFKKLNEMPSFMSFISDNIKKDIKFIEDSKLVDESVLSALKLVLSEAIVETGGYTFREGVIDEITQVYSNDEVKKNARTKLESINGDYKNNNRDIEKTNNELKEYKNQKEEKNNVSNNVKTRIRKRWCALALAISLAVGSGVLTYKGLTSFSNDSTQVTEEKYDGKSALLLLGLLEIVLGVIIAYLIIIPLIVNSGNSKELEKDILDLNEKISSLQEELNKYYYSNKELIESLNVILEFLSREVAIPNLTEDEKVLLEDVNVRRKELIHYFEGVK